MTDPKPTSRAERLRARFRAGIRAARARWPWFDHVVRAYQRHAEVSGGQLAASITFYGFLSFFPLLALAFAVVGYISGAYPDAQDAVTRAVEDTFPSLIGSGPGRINIQDVIDAKAGQASSACSGCSTRASAGSMPCARPCAGSSAPARCRSGS